MSWKTDYSLRAHHWGVTILLNLDSENSFFFYIFYHQTKLHRQVLNNFTHKVTFKKESNISWTYCWSYNSALGQLSPSIYSNFGLATTREMSSSTSVTSRLESMLAGHLATSTQQVGTGNPSFQIQKIIVKLTFKA